MKRVYLCLLALLLMTGAATAQVVDPGWAAFVIRAADAGGVLPTIANDGTYGGTDALHITTTLSGQKVGLGTDLINGVKISQISTLHIDRLDPTVLPWSLYGPYFNIWVTDGLGNYAVLANEPSDGEWAGSRWDVPDWNFLQSKLCKVYETTGASGGDPLTSWVGTYTGITTGLTFADVANLTIAVPPAALRTPAYGVGSGAPDELGTNAAYGFNWIFGDTQANYASGYVVDNYSVSAAFPVTNLTQLTYFTTIQAAVDAANPGDDISVAAGHYEEQVHITLDNLSITGAGVGSTFIDCPPVLALSYATPGVKKPVVLVENAVGVALSELTVDGLGLGNANNSFQGVAFWNAGGSLSNASVLNVRDTPFSGAQHGVAIYAYNNTGGPYTVAVNNVLVQGFQKNAFALNGTGLTADLDNVTVTGAGPERHPGRLRRLGKHRQLFSKRDCL